MNMIAYRLSIAAGLALLAGNLNLAAADAPAGPFSGEIKPAAVLDVMQHVADWQLAQPQDTNRPTVWITAVGDVGMVALAGISADPKYRTAMMAKGTNINWDMPGYRGRQYFADDQCIGQVWTDLYFQYRKNGMIASVRKELDNILARPSTVPGLAFNQPRAQEQWSWCDALFMAPPTWLRLAAATEDERYLDFAVTNWWRTVDYLYDKDAHLIYRDSRFMTQKEANGQKLFWSRGNGWVFAAIPRMLQYLPANHPGPAALRADAQRNGGQAGGHPAGGRALACQPAGPGQLSAGGNQRVGFFHLWPGVGGEPRSAGPGEI